MFDLTGQVVSVEDVREGLAAPMQSAVCPHLFVVFILGQVKAPAATACVQEAHITRLSDALRIRLKQIQTFNFQHTPAHNSSTRSLSLLWSL